MKMYNFCSPIFISDRENKKVEKSGKRVLTKVKLFVNLTKLSAAARAAAVSAQKEFEKIQKSA